MKQADIIIIGAGIVGLSLALALEKTQLNILVLDRKLPQPRLIGMQFDDRVFAINRASQALWENLGVWPHILEQRLCQYSGMRVWDEGSLAKFQLDAGETGRHTLGAIIEHSVIQNALLTRLKNSSVQILEVHTLQQITPSPDAIEIVGEDQSFQAKLLIGADGGNSWTRSAAGINCDTRSYQQSAIVSTIKTEKPHENTAYQRFLSSGPLAFLPLSDPQTCSIVWSLDEARVSEIMTLTDNDFCAQLSDAFENSLGKILESSPRLCFPLVARQSTKYVQNRFALVGDAAHTIHPLAGQGVNLGLADAAYLAELICKKQQKHRDFSALHHLRPYERARKSEAALMLAAMGGFKNLFGSDDPILRWSREFGVNWTNRLLPLKRYISHKASGKF